MMSFTEEKAHGREFPRHGRLRLLGTGFNAHHQICESADDVHEFLEVHSSSAGSGPRVLFAGWSNTVFGESDTLISRGVQRIEPQIRGTGASAQKLRSAIGDHDGLLGCLDNDGRLYVTNSVEDTTEDCHQDILLQDRLVCQNTESSPRIGHIAQAHNGRVALTFRQAPNGKLCHLAEFSAFETFQQWFKDPSGEGNYPECHSMLPGRPKQLVAGTATFLLLMDTGEVYSWGDARYESLGRTIGAKDSAPADQPGLVEALGGLKITSISGGGWMSAALSEDGALYLWGAMSPSSEGTIECLRAAEIGSVSLVDITSPQSEPLDVRDVALGDNHVLVVAGEHSHVYAVGDNRNGQLGLGNGLKFSAQWQQVPGILNAKSVYCGQNTSWIVVAEE